MKNQANTLKINSTDGYLHLEDLPHHCCPEKFYHKVSCLFESSSETLTGSSGLL